MSQNSPRLWLYGLVLSYGVPRSSVERATGRLIPAGFLVLKGSQAVLKERASSQQYPSHMVQRKRLIEDGTLIEQGDHLKFTRDSEFTSPSAAATVVQGGPANGLTAWKSKDGKSLKELEDV
jgi:hypothetical protein